MNLPASLTVKVARRTTEAQDICSFELVDPAGHALPAFTPGSHIDVYLPEGIVRQYSLCNDPRETHRYLIAVLNEPSSRGGSRAMHALVREGDTLKISTPRNHFALASGASRSVLLAGGIGITPLLCMAESLLAAGADFEMHYCARSPARTAFRGRIGDGGLAQRVRFHFDDGDAAQKLCLPELLADPVAGTHVYVCGPKGFMDAVLGAARAAGWPEAQLHCEYFAGGATPRADDGAFEVRAARTGKLVTVPADKTVVQALAEAGIHVPVSCEQGVCGTCLTRVIEGAPDHRDMFLTPQEQAANDRFTPCCSRSTSRLLVLDL